MPLACHRSRLRTIGTGGTPSASSERHSAAPLRPDAPMTCTWTGSAMLLR